MAMRLTPDNHAVQPLGPLQFLQRVLSADLIVNQLLPDHVPVPCHYAAFSCCEVCSRVPDWTEVKAGSSEAQYRPTPS